MRLTLLISVAILAPAPAPSEQAPPPTFAAQAELVTVDVVVLGPDGKPVSGLTRDDFIVKEDGRPQAITAFEAVEARLPVLESPKSVGSAPSLTRVATNVAGPPTRRTFAIVFDDLHVSELNMEQAKRAVETFVTRQTVSGDRLVLATVSDARFWATNRGAEDGAWREALRGVRSRRPQQEQIGCRVTHYEAMRIEEAGDLIVAARVKARLDLLCPEDRLAADAQAAIGRAGGSSSSPERSMQSMKIAGLYARARTLLANSLRFVRDIVRGLGAISGRKSLVLVTEGFPSDPSLDVFREVREEAARANVAISFLDARGLATGPEFLSAAGTTSVPPQDVGPTIALWKLEDGGSKALAEETGGLVLQTNDLVAGLEKVADESRVTYLLGYEPTNEKRDGRYRKLSVEVRRPGLQVRARSGYFAAKGGDKPAPRATPVQRALRGIFDADAIPLRLAAYTMGPAPVQSRGPKKSRGPKTGVEVLIAFEVRLDALESRVKDGRRVADPKVRLLTGSREGESHESDWTLDVVLPLAEPSETVEDGTGQPRSSSAVWQSFLTRVVMGPGDHRARLAVQSGSRVGSITLDFVVPPTTDERLSTPILSDRLVDNASERRVMPLARRTFDAGHTLNCWVELHGARSDSTTNQPRATAAFVARSADGREWASGAPIAMKVGGGGLTWLLDIPLADAPPGEHELVLRVKDQASGATFEAHERFRVEENPAQPNQPRGPEREPGRPPSS